MKLSQHEKTDFMTLLRQINKKIYNGLTESILVVRIFSPRKNFLNEDFVKQIFAFANSFKGGYVLLQIPDRCGYEKDLFSILFGEFKCLIKDKVLDSSFLETLEFAIFSKEENNSKYNLEVINMPCNKDYLVIKVSSSLRPVLFVSEKNLLSYYDVRDNSVRNEDNKNNSKEDNNGNNKDEHKSFETMVHLSTSQKTPLFLRYMFKCVYERSIHNKRIYKYMPLGNFFRSIEDSTLFLCEPSMWKDDYEKYFYEACYKSIVTSASVQMPKTYATCLTSLEENEAAWKVYSGGVGLSTFCVQLYINFPVLVQMIKKNNIGYNIFFAPIRYENPFCYDKIKNKCTVDSFFHDFDERKFNELLCVKRTAYQHEKEIRLFARKKDFEPIVVTSQPDSVTMKVDWDIVIERLRVDSKSTYSERLCLLKFLNKLNLNPNWINNANPSETNPPVNSAIAQSIDVEIYDIDKPQKYSRQVIPII